VAVHKRSERAFLSEGEERFQELPVRGTVGVARAGELA
jgi:hypothetical protein